MNIQLKCSLKCILLQRLPLLHISGDPGVISVSAHHYSYQQQDMLSDSDPPQTHTAGLFSLTAEM